MKLKFYYKICLFLFPVIYSSLVFALPKDEDDKEASQEISVPQQDFRLWSGATLEYNISKKFRLYLEQQLRLDDNFSGFSSTFTQFGVRYSLHRFVRFRVNYRYIIRDSDLNNRHRISGDLILRYRKKNFPLRFNYRARFQKIYMGGGENPINFLRNKLEISYNLSRLIDPFVAGEMYYRIWNKPNDFQKYRLDFGLDWRLGKKCDLTTFYRFQKEINVTDPVLDHIIGIGYSATIN